MSERFPVNSEGQLTIHEHKNTDNIVDGKLVLRRPTFVAPIEFPWFEVEGKRIKHRLHTDSMYELIKSLKELDPIAQTKIYVQGRLIDQNEWKILREDPIYRYNLNTRFRWVDEEGQKIWLRGQNLSETSTKSPTRLFELLPKKLNIDPHLVGRYRNMTYGAETKLEGYSNLNAWYQAKWLVDMQFSLDGMVQGIMSNTFLPLFGGFNTLKIGANNFIPGKIRRAASIINKNFEYQAAKTVGSKQTKIANSQLSSFDMYPL